MPALSLFLLGPIELQCRGQQIDVHPHDRLQALLAYLAVERRHAYGRQSLAALLWPETDEAHSRANLRQLLHRLRLMIGDTDPTQPLLLSPDGMQFCSDADIWVDVEQFAALLAHCRAPSRGAAAANPAANPAESAEFPARLRQAVALYRGEFLAGLRLPDSAPYQEWVTLKQAELHNQALAALTFLAQWHEQQGEHAEAAHYVEQQLKLEPWSEDAHRLRMRILAAEGKRTAALQQYIECRRVLADEFGVSPSQETEHLYQAIRHNLPLNGHKGDGVQASLLHAGGRLAADAARPDSAHPSAARSPAPRPADLFLAADQAVAQGNYLLAADRCEQLAAVARQVCDADMLWLAEGLSGANELFHGDLQRACLHLTNVCDADMQERARSLRRLTGVDFLAASLNWLQWALRVRGYSRHAQQRFEAALVQARDHRLTIDFLNHWRKLMRCWADAQPCAANVRSGERREPAAGSQAPGREQLLDYLVQVRECAAANETPRALLLISQAQQLQETSGLHLFMAEFYRLRAEQLLQLAGAQTAQTYVRYNLEKDAEASLRIAIELAHVQQIPLWELRSTISLSRLYQLHGCDTEAVALLNAVYSRFTQEFDLPELRDAQSLLQQLRTCCYGAGA